MTTTTALTPNDTDTTEASTSAPSSSNGISNLEDGRTSKNETPSALARQVQAIEREAERRENRSRIRSSEGSRPEEDSRPSSQERPRYVYD